MRHINHILIVLRLSNFELFLVHTHFLKKSPIELFSVEELKKGKYQSLFKRIYLRKAIHKPSQASIKALESKLTLNIQKQNQFQNLELALILLTSLEILPVKFMLDQPKLGAINR